MKSLKSLKLTGNSTKTQRDTKTGLNIVKAVCFVSFWLWNNLLKTLNNVVDEKAQYQAFISDVSLIWKLFIIG